MADLYTSYETSLALQSAGAPQDVLGAFFLCPDEGFTRHFWCSLSPMLERHPRAFRADEIIEALGDRLSSILQPSPGTWKVTVFNPNDFHRSRATSLVEALAAAWLAVLKEPK